MKFKSSIIFLLCVLLSHSSFSVSQYLKELLATHGQTPAQLDYGLGLKLTSAYKVAYTQSRQGSAPWLRYGQILGRSDPNYAWAMAQHFFSQQDAQFSHYWYQKALELGSQQAIINLGQSFLSQQRFNEQQLQNLKVKISRFIDSSEEAQKIAIELAIWADDRTWLNSILPHLSQPKQLKLKQWLLDIRFDDQVGLGVGKRQKDQANVLFTNIEQQDRCANSIQFFATNKANINKINGYLSTLKQHKFFGQQFCFLPVRYINEQALGCTNNASAPIQCREDIYANLDLAEHVRYIATVVPFGGANVNHGILYMDSRDDIKVLEHELLHLLGFIDEYPLPEGHRDCEPDNAPLVRQNVYITHPLTFLTEQEARAKLKHVLPWFDFIKASTPITHKTDQGYQLGTPMGFANEVGVFATDSCDLSSSQAFKAVASTTQMQHFELALEPIYQEMINRGEHNLKMPAYYYNLGLYARQQGHLERANHWFKKAGAVEKIIERQRLISQGEY
ncbi:hypothetical protein [Thalassotalea aquiviva]|uniref:hypothetical protein n=1 Tax=Thalassotalea aquiviva TaxID=3242415 RepID=UPI003529E6AB